MKLSYRNTCNYFFILMVIDNSLVSTRQFNNGGQPYYCIPMNIPLPQVNLYPVFAVRSSS